jgi:hypothetical protein
MPLDFGATDYRQAMHQWFQNIMQPRPKGAAYEGQVPTGIECGQVTQAVNQEDACFGLALGGIGFEFGPANTWDRELGIQTVDPGHIVGGQDDLEFRKAHEQGEE